MQGAVLQRIRRSEVTSVTYEVKSIEEDTVMSFNHVNYHLNGLEIGKNWENLLKIFGFATTHFRLLLSFVDEFVAR